MDNAAWAAAVARNGAETALALERHSIHMPAIKAARERLGIFPFGTAPHRDGESIRRDRNGDPVILLPEMAGGEVVDVVVMRLSDPGEAVAIKQLCGVLGEEIADRDLYVDGQTNVWATPLDWLRSGCDGCCIIDWTRPPYSLMQGELICQTGDLARRIRSLFAVPSQGPRLLVRQDQQGVAA